MESVITRDFFAEYEVLRGHPFQPPGRAPLYFGSVPWQCLPFLATSIEDALREARQRWGPARPDGR